MKVAATLIALAGAVSAFAPVQNVNKGATALSANLMDMPGATMPFKGFDPLGLATLGSESTLAWFRAAELKHSRVAMLATTGYLVQAAGVHFPGMLSSDVSFETLSAMKPLDAWDAVPDLGEFVSFFTVKALHYNELYFSHISKSNSLTIMQARPRSTSPFSSPRLSLNRKEHTTQRADLCLPLFSLQSTSPPAIPKR